MSIKTALHLCLLKAVVKTTSTYQQPSLGGGISPVRLWDDLCGRSRISHCDVMKVMVMVIDVN